MYDRFGKEYMNTRKQKHPSRAYNEFLEMPAMIKAVGDIEGKRLLDIGCGAGTHIIKYQKKGARCFGIDISATMIGLAKKNCPDAEFKVGTLRRLPYKSNSYDIVTASLSLDYVDDLLSTFKEICRVLKKGGIFYYSNESPINLSREYYEDDTIIVKGLGKIVEKKTGKTVSLGNAWNEGVQEWDMDNIPGMSMKTYRKTFRTQLLALRKAGFELIDFIDCKPTKGFSRHNPSNFKTFSKFPIFSIYVAKKK